MILDRLTAENIKISNIVETLEKSVSNIADLNLKNMDILSLNLALSHHEEENIKRVLLLTSKEKAMGKSISQLQAPKCCLSL